MDIKRLTTLIAPSSQLKPTVTAASGATNIAPIAAPTQVKSVLSEEKHIVNDTLRQLLPKQLPVAEVVAQLVQSLPTLQHNNALSPQFTALITALVSGLPQAEQLQDPQQLQSAVRDSGLFLEAKLLAGQPMPLPNTAVQQDFKAQLLQIAAALPEQMRGSALSSEDVALLADIQHKTSGALSHLVLEQLASVPQVDSPKQLWFIEIPYTTPHGEVTLKLEVEQDGTAAQERDAAAQAAWAVTLTLTPPGMATLNCKISYQSHTLNTYFWSDDAQTLQLLTAHTEQLRELYAAVGLSTGYIDVQKGRLEKTVAQRWAGHSLFEDDA